MEEHISAIPREALVFLVAAVFAPILSKRFGLGAIVGYLIAGLLVGPSALGVFTEPTQVMHVAELGVVLLLFIIGLELEPSRLFAMRGAIAGLGFGQLALTTLLVGAVSWYFGASPAGAAIVGFAFSLSSTAIAIQLLNERGHLVRPYGQRTFSVLLAQDLAIVPALAVIPALGQSAGVQTDIGAIAMKVGFGLACVATIVLAGRYVIDPLLRRLSRYGAHEVMVSAALLLVFSAAFIAEAGGLSMALGAFLAGLLLSESIYRHELEANVEPFRGILLALFFMGVGMSLDLAETLRNAPTILLALLGLLVLKVVGITIIMRASRSDWTDTIRAAALLAPTSEFAFVLIPLGVAGNLISPAGGNTLTAVGVLSMMIGPPVAGLVEWLLRRKPAAAEHHEETFDGVNGTAIVLGFGRFGQIAAQLLLARDVETTLIDNNADRIRNAARFGFKVYYGDGARLDVLRAAKADQARLIMICVDEPEHSLHIVDLVRTHFPQAKIHVRAHDREHAVMLENRGVDFELRELYESSLLFGRKALEALGVEPEEALAVEGEVRRRDQALLAKQRMEALDGGKDSGRRNVLRPEPLTEPDHSPAPLTPETAAVVAAGEAKAAPAP